MIITVALNPAIDLTLEVDHFQQADTNRVLAMRQDIGGKGINVARALKALGYEIHFSGSWWEPTRRLAIADVHHNFYEMPEMLRVVYEYSLLVDIARLVGLRQGDPLWWQCQRSRLMFGELGRAAATGQPMFYYAHFLIPHPPYVTHETGRCMEMAEAACQSAGIEYAS